jgi:hypothetical protein
MRFALTAKQGVDPAAMIRIDTSARRLALAPLCQVLVEELREILFWDH